MGAVNFWRGRRPAAFSACVLLRVASLIFTLCLLVTSVTVSRITPRRGDPQSAPQAEANLLFARRQRPQPPTLLPSTSQSWIASDRVLRGGPVRFVSRGSPLAFVGTKATLNSQPVSSFVSTPASPVNSSSATAASASAFAGQSSGFCGASDESSGNDFQPQKLGGRYCCSVSSTQRLPTRTVVVGGGEAGANAFALLHGKPLVVQQQLLLQHQKQLEQGQQLQFGVAGHAQGSSMPRGPVFVGSLHRVSLQTMTNSDTRDVDATVQQILRCAAAGADMVRLTVQGPREADASRAIVDKLREFGCWVPLVADIHFQPRVASLCSEVFDKIRINPGNFVDGRKVWEEPASNQEQTTATNDMAETGEAGRGPLLPDTVASFLGPWGSVEGLSSLLPPAERESFCEGHRRIEEAFTPLVHKCLQYKRAMRIGTNHGSLSARILRHFGDTPMGMVLSAIEFADICVRAGYYNFVFSLKSSNPATMQQAYRLMANLMAARGSLFPLHLGVTEAGAGEDGRIKSAAGIGALLQDGIGDTVRASLTEPPWAELPVCRFLRRMQEHKVQQAKLQEMLPSQTSPLIPKFKETTRNFAVVEPRGNLRLGRHPSAPEASREAKEEQTVLHRDGTAIVAIDPQELVSPGPLFASLGLRIVEGEPFRTLLSADAVYVRSLFFSRSSEQEQHPNQRQGLVTDQSDRSQQLLAARQTLLQLLRAGLTVWADAREIQQVQMTREQLLQNLLQQSAARGEQQLQQQQLLLQALDKASLYMPGMVAVQRMQDAAAVGSALSKEYLGDTAGVALVADGTETAEEVQAVVNRLGILCVLVRPADRATSGVAAARRIGELLRQAESKQRAEGVKSSEGALPVIQWIDAPPPALLSSAPAQKDRQRVEGYKVEGDVSNQQAMTMFAAWEAGNLLLDRLADGVMIDAPKILNTEQQRQLALDLLQGCRMRSTKTEFISCPSCGRTLFDIQKVSAKIRSKTGHLPGVKIAVMGCIVNGIGEMGDADFGYVGGAPGLVDLYVGKKLVRRGVKSSEACDALIEIIKAEGRWKEPDEVQGFRFGNWGGQHKALYPSQKDC